MLAVCLLVLLADPVPVLFDTDMASDCDDVAALSMLHALADRGEARILATVINRGDAAGRSAAATDAVNTFRGRPEIPIGVDRQARFVRELGRSSFTAAVADLVPHVRNGPDSGFPAAVAAYRDALAAQPDGSVTICSVGALSNLAALLESEGGVELITAKVARLVVMGGGFPRTQRPETNLLLDPVAAARVANDWPTEILWQGFEVGTVLVTGSRLTERPADDPQRRAFELRPYRGRPAIAGGKPSHDQAAVLLAVRGPQPDLWSLSSPGRVVVDSLGNSEWHPIPPRRHRYVRIKADPLTLETIIEDLMLAPPSPAN